MKRRLAPFARSLRVRLSKNEPPKNGVNIHCGSQAWERAQTYIEGGTANVAHLVFPNDAKPTDINWTVLRNLEVTVLHNPDNPIERPTLEELAVEIVRAGACKAYLVDHEHPLKIYIPRRIAA